jgi:hypothetical protein
MRTENQRNIKNIQPRTWPPLGPKAPSSWGNQCVVIRQDCAKLRRRGWQLRLMLKMQSWPSFLFENISSSLLMTNLSVSSRDENKLTKKKKKKQTEKEKKLETIGHPCGTEP